MPCRDRCVLGGERNRGTSREQREGNAAKTQGGDGGGEKGTRGAAKGAR